MAIRLLIIDGGSPLQENWRRRLRRESYQVFTASRQTRAVQIVREKGIDVVILDLNSLKRSGLTLLERIRAASPDTEVILLNHPDQIALSIAGMKLGAFDDLLVPFDIETLICRIRAAYERKAGSAT